jgi:hypothetical protein
MDFPECDFYIPYHEVFNICGYHDENRIYDPPCWDDEKALRAGAMQCMSPLGNQGPCCSDHCPAQKKLQKMVMPVPKGYLDNKPASGLPLPPLGELRTNLGS